VPDYSDFLKRQARDSLSTDALYAAHGETAFGNPAWASARSRILIVRLSPFRDVERSTPHEFLFREARAAMPEAYMDFCFFPTRRDRAVLDAAGVPWMHGLASGRGAIEYDALLVSNSYTLELVNLAPFLEASGIPASRRERDAAVSAAADGARFPLIALGGSNAMASAAQYDEASGDAIVDAVFFGEGEGAVRELIPGLAAAALAGGSSRLAALETLARRVRGFWPTALRIEVDQAKAPADAYPQGAPPVLAGAEAGTSRLEITRGCPSFCSFCFEGWERKPFRERPLASVVAEAKRLKAATGVDTVELASYNFNAHGEVVAVIESLHKIFWGVGFQSQRVDILARSPSLVRFEVAAGKRSFTVGVEGVSSRMRAYYSKGLDEADLRSVLERLVREGARELKLFYILSGYEADDDLAELSAFVGWLRGVVAAQAAPPRVMFSAGELVRMPFTPLRYEALILDEAVYAAIRSRFEAIVESGGFEARAPERFDEYCLSQLLASAPDGSFALLLAMAERGYVYDRTLSAGAWEFARERLLGSAERLATLVAEKPRHYRFPYSLVRPLVSGDRIYERFLDARSNLERPSCLGGDCAACGACQGDERAFLAAHRLGSATEADLRAVEAVVAAKRRPYETWVRSTLPREAATADPAYPATLFRRDLYAALPALVDTVWTAEDALLKNKTGLERLPGAWGDTWYRVLSSDPIDPDALETAGYAVGSAAPAPERLYLRVSLAGASHAEAARLVAGFLDASAIPHTLRKTAAATVFAVSDKGRKKRNILEASIPASLQASVQGRAIIDLACGSKYDVANLMKAAAKRGLYPELRVGLEPLP